ncbi:MAG TPA: serine/threonine-protein kinase [Kofleriaceae bacterium]|nr:serine/threonine-protein kinase [Kofleriaceae bacterium]
MTVEAAPSRYQVLARIASGGMGEILLARRAGPAGFQKLVVLKRALAASAGSPSVVAALIDEARLLAQINHANVCQILDLEHADGEYVLVLEYLEGLSLWSILSEAEEAQRAIEAHVVCGLIEQALVGLDAIHHLRARDGSVAGVIHRDISPGNLFLTEDGTLKILDLGIAKRSDATDPGAGMIRGKLPYMAPEQIACRSLDARTDLLALGLVFHDLLRGRRPPNGRVGAVSHEALELDAIAPPLAAVVRRAIADDAAARFASAGDMAVAVRDAATETGGVASRAELAAWLARDHAHALETQRERTRAALAALDDPTVVTKTLTLHTMLLADDLADDLDDEPLAAPPSREASDARPFAASLRTDGGVEDADALPRRTERLAASTTELPHRDPVVEPPVAPRLARRFRRGIWIGAVVATAGAAAVAAFALADADRVPPRTLPPQSAMAPPDVPAPSSPPSPSPSPAPAPPAPSLPLSVGAEPAMPDRSSAPAPPSSSESHESHESPSKRSAAHAAPGLLTIDSQPYALVTLGKVQLGHTPLFQESVRAGRYTVHAAIPDGRTQDISIRIDAGRECRVVLRWNGAASKRAGC